MNSGSPPESEAVFFVDRNLGRHIVPTALRTAGAKVIAHDDKFPQDAPDSLWLKEAGESGWVVITRDAKIRYRRDEKEALIDSGALVFVVTAGDMTAHALAELLVKALPNMRQIAATATRPAIFSISASGKPREVGLGS